MFVSARQTTLPWARAWLGRGLWSFFGRLWQARTCFREQRQQTDAGGCHSDRCRAGGCRGDSGGRGAQHSGRQRRWVALSNTTQLTQRKIDSVRLYEWLLCQYVSNLDFLRNIITTNHVLCSCLHFFIDGNIEKPFFILLDISITWFKTVDQKWECVLRLVPLGAAFTFRFDVKHSF